MTIAAAFVAGAMMLAGGGIAYADTLVVEDELMVGGSSNLQLGTVACGEPRSVTVDLVIERGGNATGGNAGNNTVFKEGTSAAISKVSVGAGASASDPTVSSVAIPAGWYATGDSLSAGQSTITVTTSTAGQFSSTVVYRASGTNAKDGERVADGSVTVRWTVGSCTAPPPADTVAPVVTLECPSEPVLRNEPATASWSATDNVGFASGTVTSGTVSLDTSTYGAKTKTLAAGFIADAAGNTSAAVSCNYSVTEQDPPVVTFANCPDPLELVMEQEYVLTWNATDEEGGSGLATDATGTITIDTDVYGPGSVTAPIARDNAGNESAQVKCEYFVDDVTPPVVNLTCPVGPFLLGETVPDAQWTASDPSPGSGLAGADSGSIAVSTSSVGAKTLSVPAGAVSDIAENTSLESNVCSYSVVYDFTGFLRPVDMGTTFNSVKAGSAVPMKFSLDGDQGLGIIAAGFPKINRYTCGPIPNVDPIEETVNAGGSSLSYDPVTDQYNYVWKTDKGWAGSCGTFTLKLDDGTTHTVNFQFKK
ncbi:PxKF domain-containing protein [Agromyces sp. C10]|uniref:PxKF domain-containing protein n=1 Tax=Agromyces sp. C10 TaxID=2935077 RepID=UPI00200ABF92|nr:PxKF domain-containing protein [Agromyces sp. C10]MCK8610044.1 PxKF domain-containing protein [Agromyces sp. C10]